MADQSNTPKPTPQPVIKEDTNTIQQPEVTKLSPVDEAFFRMWAQKSGINDLDNNKGKYDYRGYWKAFGPTDYKWGVDHLPDTWKQHGHPTFSQESVYSKGPFDGGMWLTGPDLDPLTGQLMERFLEQPKMAVSHEDKSPNKPPYEGK